MWYARREHVWNGKLYMGRPYQVGSDGLLVPQPGGEDMADILRMKSMPSHFVFRVDETTDPGDAETAGEAAAPAPAEPPAEPPKKGGRKKKETP